MRIRQLAISALFAVALASCGSATKSTTSDIPPISGLARVSDAIYITVHDAKAFEPDAIRVGTIRINDEDGEVPLTFKPLTFPSDASGPSSDLESICRLPGRPWEFLVSESGYWEGNYGRIFHVAVGAPELILINEMPLPKFRDNNPEQLDGDQFEGIACVARSESEYLVFLGERGGTDVYPTGIIRWGVYDVDAGSIAWSELEILVEAPNPWKHPELRSITGLSVDDQNRLWASAAVDTGDYGPFRSLVYLVGTVDPEADVPLTYSREPYPHVVNGFKIEGVSAGGADAVLSIGTEDEAFGGTWRQVELQVP